MPVQGELTSLAIVVLAGLLCGMAMTRLRQPAVVGYILAGIALGPSALGLVADRHQIELLAELGVLLLLFVVGMELSLRGFRAVWVRALATAGLQIGGAVGLMILLSSLFDWPLGVAILLGFVVAISSTAVVIKMLEDMNLLRTQVGQITVAVLIAQDLAIVPMLLAIRMFAGAGTLAEGLAPIAGAMILLGFLIWYLSRRKRIVLPFSGLMARHAELRPVYGLTFCFGAAALSGVAGLSAAYGAFLAGLVVGNSSARRPMLRSVQPIQDLLMMAFFLSIGLLLDLTYLWENLTTVLFVLFVVTVVKTGLNIGILALLREPWPHAFIAGLLLAQIGEFSFLLSAAGADVGLIGPEAHQLVIAVTALTLLVSPLWLATARRLLRIALLSISSAQEGVRLLLRGGWADLWRAAIGPAPNAAVAARFFGRPGRKRPAAPPPPDAPPPDAPLPDAPLPDAPTEPDDDRGA